MRRIGLLSIILAFMMLFSGCLPDRSLNVPLTPEPEATPAVAADSPVAPDEPGSLGMLADILSEKLNRTISAGSDADKAATGIEAAKLVVTSLGLASDALLNAMGQGTIDYLSVAMEKEIAPVTFLTSHPMTEERMREFADVIAQKVEAGALSSDWRGEVIPLDSDLRAMSAIAVIATNPLAAGRGDHYYGDGNSDKLSYWTLAAIGTVLAEMDISDQLSAKIGAFVGIRDQTDPSRGTTTADELNYSRLMRELWGVAANSSADGLSALQGRVYLGSPKGDLVRQYPTAYRAEISGDRVRIYANVINASASSQFAGKVAVTLRKTDDALLGYQIVSIEHLSYRMWKFADAESPGTAKDSDAAALVDDDLTTVWKIGNVAGEDANLTVSFNTPMILSGLAIYNGNHSRDQATLDRDGYAGRIGIRFDGEEKDRIRLDISARVDSIYAGYPVVVPFEEEFSVESVTIIFYNDNAKDPITISDIRGF